MRRLSKWTIAASIGVALVVLCGMTATAFSASEKWDHVEGTRHASDGDVAFDLWRRGGDAVLIESVEGKPISESRCEKGTLLSHSSGSVSVVIREGLSGTKCFDWATDSLLGFSRAVAKYNLKSSQASAGTSAFESSSGPIRRLLLNDAQLPVGAEMASGEVLRWDYVASPSDSTPPAFDGTGILETETYRDLAVADAAVHFGLAAVPESIAGLPLETVFSYDATTARGTAYYAIWDAPEGQSIQLNIVPAVPPKEALGLQQDGTVLALSEGSNQVRIVVSDPALLRSAVEALRPSSLDALAAS